MSAPKLIVMLTHNDRTVPNAAEIFEAHFPRVKRLGCLLFWGFGLLDLACMLCYDRWLYQVLPVSYSRISGGIFCLCICTVLIGMYLASRSRDDP